ncbi:Hypothetical protein A7982_09701 [Minicystis rosea]|nr:Hypothetical protein A7982_09701 [Minicystis rosea]
MAAGGYSATLGTARGTRRPAIEENLSASAQIDGSFAARSPEHL